MIDYIYLFKSKFIDLFLNRFNNWKQGIHTFRVWCINKYYYYAKFEIVNDSSMLNAILVQTF